MLHRIDPSAERFLADLERIQAAEEQAQRELSSGLRVSRPSDAPGEVGAIVQLSADLDRVARVESNLGRVKGEVDLAEEALQTAVRLVETALQLGGQGATGTATAAAREMIARQVEAVQEQMVGLSRTRFESRFVFSGDRDDSPAYALNLAAPRGVDPLLAAPATRRIEDVSGISFDVAKTAAEIFDDPARSVFGALNALRTALLNGPPAAIAAALDGVREAGAHLNEQLAYYGAVQNRVNAAIDLAAKFQLRLRTSLGERRDADLTEAAIELTRARTHYETALAARARSPQTSLFDVLK